MPVTALHVEAHHHDLPGTELSGQIQRLDARVADPPSDRRAWSVDRRAGPPDAFLGRVPDRM